MLGNGICFATGGIFGVMLIYLFRTAGEEDEREGKE